MTIIPLIWSLCSVLAKGEDATVPKRVSMKAVALDRLDMSILRDVVLDRREMKERRSGMDGDSVIMPMKRVRLFTLVVTKESLLSIFRTNSLSIIERTTASEAEGQPSQCPACQSPQIST